MTEALESPQESAFIIATLQNAHELVVDAEILLKHDRWARSFALATFAVEETRKAWLADHTLAFEPRRTVKGVRHEGKIELPMLVSLYYQVELNGLVNLENVYSEEHEFWSGEDFDNRMAGLYVDFVGGQVVGGASTTSPQHARDTGQWAAAVTHIGMGFLWTKHGGA